MLTMRDIFGTNRNKSGKFTNILETNTFKLGTKIAMIGTNTDIMGDSC